MKKPTLSQLLAAYLLFESISSTQKLEPPYIRQNLQKLWEKVQSKTATIDYECNYKLKRISQNTLMNVYKNLCNDKKIKHDISNLLKVHNLIKEEFDLETNLAPLILETVHETCIFCQSKLDRRIKYEKGKNGSRGILYCNKSGPIICIHYLRRCKNKECKTTYFHGRYEHEGDIYFDEQTDQKHMVSKSTFFTQDFIEECWDWNLSGISTEMFTKKYNKRFEKEIIDIQQVLIVNDQTLGHRKKSEVCLCDKRVLEAVSLARLISAIKQDLHKDVIVFHTELERYKAQQIKIVRSQSNSQSSSQSSSVSSSQSSQASSTVDWINSKCLFDILWDKHGADLHAIPDEWLRYVPVKNRTILYRHFFVQGDGNQKIKRRICAFPGFLHQQECEKDKEMLPDEKLKCQKSPQKGNDKQPCLVTCIEHSLKLRNCGCSIELINKFCKYHELKQKLIGLKNGNQSNDNSQSNKITKLQEALNNFKKDDIKKIEAVTQTMLCGNVRRSQRNLTKTKANINESIQYDNDEDDLCQLETICQEANVNPALLINPELSKLMENERFNEDTWNSLNGCRKGRHVINQEKDSLFHTTGGVQSWMTQSNFILSLTENVHRETPTQVISQFSSLMTSTPVHEEYASRITGVGYDMMCTLYGRLRNLINEGLLESKQTVLWINLLPRLFVDKWHVHGHVNLLCRKDSNLLNPYCRKFKELFNNTFSNDQIVEQNWKTINQLKYARNLGQRKFNFILYDFKKRHNNENWKHLQRLGYTFVNIKSLTKINDLSERECHLPSTFELQNEEKYQVLTKVDFIGNELMLNDNKNKRKKTTTVTPNRKKRKRSKSMTSNRNEADRTELEITSKKKRKRSKPTMKNN